MDVEETAILFPARAGDIFLVQIIQTGSGGPLSLLSDRYRWLLPSSKVPDA
jgi:hypothetical protein